MLRFYETKQVVFTPVMQILSNFQLGGMSSSQTGVRESAKIRYQQGYLSKKKKFALLKKPVNPSRFRTHPAVPELSALCIILAVFLKGGKMFPQIVHDSGF